MASSRQRNDIPRVGLLEKPRIHPCVSTQVELQGHPLPSKLTPKLLESVLSELGIITGQKANTNRAKKSISNFGLREGMPVGASVTLRRTRMWFFLDRLISTAIPRVRDFRGLSTRSFDGRGNYTMGVREQIIFPEINFDDVRKIHGMDLTFVTSTDKDDEGFALLRALGFPFRGEVPVQIGATA